jgi:nucleoside-diphosphate-sugar epimerase
MKKLVILGGTGYIGKNIVNTFSKNGDKVYSLGSKDIDLNDLIHSPTKLARLLKGSDCLIICSAITRTTANNSNSCFTNINQLNTIMQACELELPKHIVYCSAADVYGHGGSLITEDAPISPMNEYGAFKAFAEKMLQLNFSERCNVSIFRFSGVFGGDSDQTSLINRLTQSIRMGKEITLSNEGLSKRDYLPVSLLCDAIVEIINLKYAGIFNVSTGQEKNIIDTVKHIEQLIGKKANLILTDDFSERDFDLSLSNTKLHLMLPHLHIPSLNSALKVAVKRY